MQMTLTHSLGDTEAEFDVEFTVLQADRSVGHFGRDFEDLVITEIRVDGLVLKPIRVPAEYYREFEETHRDEILDAVYSDTP